MNLKVKNALISVSNKENLISILKILKKFNINIISSGGTYASIKKLGYQCLELSKFTGFKEMLDGRVKTLHPKIHAGILHDRQNKNIKVKCQNKIFRLSISLL
jgi:phosphoribosylaminoimidazolecarboxamide formyltransferase/IMP cyclohydrolase